MAGTRLPFSVDLDQDINPWSFWLSPALDQLGFINIKNAASSDRELERAIVRDVAGYGKQLGRISEALSVLIKQSNEAKLTPSDKETLHSFESMAEAIAAQKQRHAATTEDKLDRFLADMRMIGDTRPKTYNTMVDKLCRELPVERRDA